MYNQLVWFFQTISTDLYLAKLVIVFHSLVRVINFPCTLNVWMKKSVNLFSFHPLVEKDKKLCIAGRKQYNMSDCNHKASNPVATGPYSSRSTKSLGVSCSVPPQGPDTNRLNRCPLLDPIHSLEFILSSVKCDFLIFLVQEGVLNSYARFNWPKMIADSEHRGCRLMSTLFSPETVSDITQMVALWSKKHWTNSLIQTSKEELLLLFEQKISNKHICKIVIIRSLSHKWEQP